MRERASVVLSHLVFGPLLSSLRKWIHPSLPPLATANWQPRRLHGCTLLWSHSKGQFFTCLPQNSVFLSVTLPSCGRSAPDEVPPWEQRYKCEWWLRAMIPSQESHFREDHGHGLNTGVSQTQFWGFSRNLSSIFTEKQQQKTLFFNKVINFLII